MFNELNLSTHGIYWDSNENNYGRANRLNNYLCSLNKTYDPHKNLNRVTTSNGEYFYFDYFESKNLPEGDYFHNGTLFEFKSPYDLRDSVSNNRLDNQVDNVLKDKSIDRYYIISNCLSDFNFKNNEIDRTIFENLNNYFLQFTPFGISFIPVTSEIIAFRTMINIWRCNESVVNLQTLNHKERVNPYLNNLSIIPCLNRNQVTAIFNRYPGYLMSDIGRLTKDKISEVRFGKKRCGPKKAEVIMEQLISTFPEYFPSEGII